MESTMSSYLWIKFRRIALSRICLYPLTMRTFSLLTLFLLAQALQTWAFCGFYVAKADASLFNQASQVIIARDGRQTVITMSSDFQGQVKDFAMVVPVPEVLKRDQIRIAKQSIFDKLDAYTGPRLVEYHDDNPCEDRYLRMEAMSASPRMGAGIEEEALAADDLGVSILESYTVGEYDILILSAEESDGLETWLTRNGYQIPAQAAEVLEPYIKSDLKFFVVKVNLEAFESSGYETLRPIQMSFRSERFGLPIRLGMANAQGDQDLIVYAFSAQGRIETTNYRTAQVPTGQDIPLFVASRFGEFYADLFTQSWQKEGKDAVLMEYAWDLSSSNFVKCDPCPVQPPTYAELREAGVFWLEPGRGRSSADYEGEVFITRLHARYNRKTFPQDLQFQLTPNQERFQGRYVMRHPATGDLDCKAGQRYLEQLGERRLRELDNLAQLTGWETQPYRDTYLTHQGKPLIKGRSNRGWFDRLDDDDQERNDLPWFHPRGPGGPWPLLGLAMLCGLALWWIAARYWSGRRHLA